MCFQHSVGLHGSCFAGRGGGRKKAVDSFGEAAAGLCPLPNGWAAANVHLQVPAALQPTTAMNVPFLSVQ